MVPSKPHLCIPAGFEPAGFELNGVSPNRYILLIKDDTNIILETSSKSH